MAQPTYPMLHVDHLRASKPYITGFYCHGCGESRDRICDLRGPNSVGISFCDPCIRAMLASVQE